MGQLGSLRSLRVEMTNLVLLLAEHFVLSLVLLRQIRHARRSRGREEISLKSVRDGDVDLVRRRERDLVAQR